MLHYALLALAVLAVSSASILVVLAAVPGFAAAFWRILLSLPMFYMLYRPRIARIWTPFVAGVALALHLSLWMESLFHASVAVSTTVVCTHSIFSGIVMAFKGERPSALQVIGIFAALTGIYMLSGADPAAEPIGVALALAAAVFGGVYFASARLARHYDFASYVFTTYLSAAIVSFVICLAMGVELVGFSLMSWVYIILLAVVPMLFGHTLLNYVLRHMEAVPVTATVMGEAVLAALLAAVLLGQKLPANTYAYMLVVLLGIALAQHRNVYLQ